MRARYVLAALLLAAGTAHAGPYTESGHAAAAMLAWATDVDASIRGPMDIDDPGAGNASFGVPENALGPAVYSSFDVFSLGDGGSITLYFASGIEDGPGDDFAVFENAFFSVGGLFGEFAFVEVSSNGVDFVRFESTSLQSTLVPGGAVIDPTDYHHLAGDQAQPLGTGFDLNALANDPLVLGGTVDLDDIGYVRLIDVIGDGTTLDGQGLPLYDPYPTPFASSGFDIESVGVIHPVPEPSALSLLGAGGLLLVQLRRRRTQRCMRAA